MEYLLTGIVITAVVVFIAFVLAFLSGAGGVDESEARRAGRRGEHFASRLISEVLNDRDILLTNVKLSYDGKRTELDNVIINNRGVFIIEVKNYSGMLVGEEDDFEWVKNKVTDAGNIDQKTVKNPIPQVKRQIYILSGRLSGAKRDAAALNAAAGLYIAGKAGSLQDGLTLANQIIDSGQAEATLNKLAGR